MEGSAEGASSEAESVLASRGPDGRPSSEAEFILAPRGPDGRPSSESEIAFASRGLSGRPSSEAGVAPRLARPQRGCSVELGRGPSVTWAFRI